MWFPVLLVVLLFSPRYIYAGYPLSESRGRMALLLRLPSAQTLMMKHRGSQRGRTVYTRRAANAASSSGRPLGGAKADPLLLNPSSTSPVHLFPSRHPLPLPLLTPALEGTGPRPASQGLLFGRANLSYGSRPTNHDVQKSSGTRAYVGARRFGALPRTHTHTNTREHIRTHTDRHTNILLASRSLLLNGFPFWAFR